MLESIHDFEAATIDGKVESLSVHKGKVLLIVNVASKCGFTPQYAGLQALYEKHKDAGFAVLGFPCDQFGHQEPGTEDEIKSFCSVNYGVAFPMYAKVKVNGKDAAPLYRFLKSAKPGLLNSKAIKWNFTKFLVGRDGAPIKRYAPDRKPESIEADLLKAL